MKALNVAWKDLRILFKDSGQIFLLLVLPLLFVLVLSGALGSIDQAPADRRVNLPVVDLDGGAAAKALLQGISAAGGVWVATADQATAASQLDKKEIIRLLTIPAGFSSDVAEGRPAQVRLVTLKDADAKTTEAVRLVVEGVARDMSLQLQLLGALAQMGEMQAGTPAEKAFAVEKVQTQARSQFQAAQARPLLTVSQRTPRQEVQQEKTEGISDIAVPGMAVLFVFLAAQATASSIHDEKKIGSFRRLMAAPMSKATLLAGKLLPNFLLALIQTAVIFAFGLVVLPFFGKTPVTLGPQPLATVIVVALIALCSTSLGILIAAVARTEAQIGGLSNVLLWGMGFLGGSMIPLFIMESFMGPIPKLVPQYWANHALVNLMVRQLGLADVLLDMAALLGFSALFLIIGVRRFEFDR